MTQNQEKHLKKIKRLFAGMVEIKYHKGAVEHGGDLQDMSPSDLLNNAILECIDQFTYLITLREKMK